MRRFVVSTLISLCVLSLAGTTRAEKGPLLRLSTREINFGRVDQHQMVSEDILIGNDGDEPLRITKVSADCGCTAGALSDSIVMPGQEVTLNISFKTGNRKGDQTKRVTLLTNDPAEPKAIVRVLADVHPLVRVSTQRIQIPTVHRGETATEQVRFAADKGLGFEVVGIEGASALFDFEIHPDPSKDEDAFVVDLKLRRDAPAGTFRASILPVTKGPQSGDVRVLVSGTILSYFVVEGETRIRYPTVKFGQRQELPIRVTCDGSKPYRLVNIESPVEFITGKITEGENGTWFVTLIVKETAPAGRFLETLRLKTTDPNQPTIDFEVLGRVQR